MKFYFYYWVIFILILFVSIFASMYEKAVGHDTNALILTCIATVGFLGSVVSSYFNEQTTKKQ